MRLSQALWQGLRRQRQKARRAKLLRHVDTAGAGLEIGPSHAPVAPKAAGFAVKVMDHAPAEVLRQKYLGHGANLDAIEEVDYIWSGQPFVDLVGDARFAWIVA